mgnify:CR=1 FL=1
MGVRISLPSLFLTNYRLTNWIKICILMDPRGYSGVYGFRALWFHFLHPFGPIVSIEHPFAAYNIEFRNIEFSKNWKCICLGVGYVTPPPPTLDNRSDLQYDTRHVEGPLKVANSLPSLFLTNSNNELALKPKLTSIFIFNELEITNWNFGRANLTSIFILNELQNNEFHPQNITSFLNLIR